MTTLNKKITELTELTTVDDTDLLAIVDVSNSETKKITRENLVANIQPVFKKLVAAEQDAGSLNLSYSGWSTSKSIITQIRISVTSGSTSDFDIELYEKDTFASDDKVYEAYEFDSTKGAYILLGSFAYNDVDNSDEIHIKIIDNDLTGSPKFKIEVWGYGLN